VAIDPAGEPSWLSVGRRLDVHPVYPDRRRPDELTLPGSRLRIDLAHLDRVGIEALLLHLLPQHLERPLPGGAFTPPEELYTRRRNHAVRLAAEDLRP
jgi:hypothetical protein